MERQEDPWTLITNPTLDQYHIHPIKTVFGALGLIIGLLLGIFYALKKENEDEILYDIDDIKAIINQNKIRKLPLSNKKDIRLFFKLLLSGLDNTKKEKFGIFYIGNLNQEIISEFKNNLLIDEDKSKFTVTGNIQELSKSEKIFGILFLGNVSKKELVNARYDLSIVGKEFESFIVFT